MSSASGGRERQQPTGTAAGVLDGSEGQADLGVGAQAEIEALRAERDALRRELAVARRRRDRRGVFRSVTVGLVAVLFAILLPVTVTAGWVHATVLDTNRWVATVGPIGGDPQVAEAVSRQLTDEIYSALQPQQVIADALPPRAAFLAAPIASGVQNFIQERVQARLSSPEFRQRWIEANRVVHAQLVAVLRGESDLVFARDGQVVLDLVPVLNAVLQDLQQQASGLIGRDVRLPTIPGDELPAVACQKLSAALDRPLPTTCGQVALFPADRLVEAQRAVRAFDRIVVLLALLVPCLFVAALAVSHQRRRTLIQLVLGAGLGLVVVRRTVFWLQDSLISAAAPENRGSRSVIVETVLHSFFRLSEWFLLGALVLLVLALLTGPYPWSRAMRRGVVGVSTATAHATTALTRGAWGYAAEATTLDSRYLGWIRRHTDALAVAGAAAFVLVLLLLPVTAVVLVVLVVVLGAYELLLLRLGRWATVA